MSATGLGSSFWRFWSGAAISQFGDGVRVTALPLLAASITTDPLPVASITAAIWLPWLLFGAVGGAIVDRLDRRRLMYGTQAVRALIAGVLTIAVVLDQASIPLLAAAAFLIGIGEVLVDGALYSVVPRVVRRELLERANGRLGASELVGNELVGPPLGGLLFGMASWVPFALDSATFGASGTLLFGIPGDFKAKREVESATSIWEDVREGVRWLFGNRLLRTLAIGLGATNLSVTGAWAVFVLLALQVLDLSGIGYGLLLSSVAVGGVLGNLIGPVVAERIGRARGMLAPLALAGVASAGVGLTTNVWVVGALFFAEGLMVGIFNVIARTLRQVVTPDHLLGRVTSGFRVFSYGLASMGALMGGTIADAFGLRAPFVVGGSLMVVITLLMTPWVTERSIAAAEGAASAAG